jgi:hypothetical protein
MVALADCSEQSLIRLITKMCHLPRSRANSVAKINEVT